MVQQDNIIEINAEKTITTSINDYFLNIAYITPSSNYGTKDATGNVTTQTFTSLSSVLASYDEDTQVYQVAKEVFAQKDGINPNKSNVKRFIVIIDDSKKDTGDGKTYAQVFAYAKNCYEVYVNLDTVANIYKLSDMKTVSGYKILYLQKKVTNASTDLTDLTSGDNALVTTDDTGAYVSNIANATRLAVYVQKESTSIIYGKDDNASYVQELAPAVASIMASNPVGSKTASFKTPAGIEVVDLTDGQQTSCDDLNFNYFASFIGGAGDYSTRELTSANGTLANGVEIQERIAIDRSILMLQSSLMDALIQDIPYDDNGGTIVYSHVNKVFAQLKNEGIFADDSVDTDTGELLPSYTINVLPIATVKKEYNEYYTQKKFIVETNVTYTGSAKMISLTFAY